MVFGHSSNGKEITSQPLELGHIIKTEINCDKLMINH